MGGALARDAARATRRMSVAGGARSSSLRRDAARALVALGLGYLIVMLAAGLLRSGTRFVAAAPEVTLRAERLDLARGEGGRAGDDWIVQAPDATGSAVLAARIDPLAAADYGEVRWQVDAADPSAPALYLAWQTRAEPRRTFVKALQRTADGNAHAELDGDDGWSGTIVGMALLTRGGFAGPVRVHEGRLRSASVLGTWEEMLAQWARPVAFRGVTITFPFDEERFDALPLPLASALAALLGALALAAYARWRGGRADARVVALLLLAAWLVLDLRWQWNFGRDAVASVVRFAGKDDDGKHRADADAELYVIMRDVARALPSDAGRVFFLADSPPLRARASYFLLPHNVFHELDTAAHAPPPEFLRAGDYVVLFLFGGLTYDPSRQALTWPDGRTREVDAVRTPEVGPVVVRIR